MFLTLIIGNTYIILCYLSVLKRERKYIILLEKYLLPNPATNLIVYAYNSYNKIPAIKQFESCKTIKHILNRLNA